jgi:general secretion pathway protein A
MINYQIECFGEKRTDWFLSFYKLEHIKHNIMYKNFYQFKEKPFQIVPNPRYLYRSEKHKKALSYLEYGLSEDIGFVLLTGEVGSGKTTLIQFFLSRLDDSTQAAVIYNTNVSPDELLRMILNEFDIEPSGDKAADLDALYRLFLDYSRSGKKVLLVIDEGQNLTYEALEEIRLLSNLQTKDRMLLQIMMVGQPELSIKLKQPSMRQFSQRIAVRYHLTGLNRRDTSNYIAYRMMRAGGKPDLFTKAAVDLIYDMSEGIPRAINLACQAALLYGFMEQADVITQDVIKQILDDQLLIGVVKESEPPEAAREEETTPAPPDNEMTNKIDQRISVIEDKLEGIQDTVDGRISDMETQLADIQKDIIERFQALYQEEQRKNIKLVQELSQLKLKYKALLELSKNKMRGGVTLIK